MRLSQRVAVVALLLGVLAGPSLAQTGNVTTIRVASNANDDVTPLLYADHVGMFARAGIRIDFTHMNSGAAVTAAVIGGSIDVGKSSLLPLISAHSRGLPLSMIAPGELWLAGSPISALVANKSATFANAKDLSGKTIAVQAVRDLSEVALRAWIDQNGGDSKAVRIVEIPQAAILGALVDGRADAANMTGPGLAEVLASGKTYVVARPDDAVGKRFLLTAWFASDAYVAQNHAVVKRFLEIMLRAAAYTNKHHAETVPITAPFWGIEPAVLARMPRAEISDVLDPHEIQPVVDAAAKYQVIERTFDAKQLISSFLLIP